MNLSSRSGVWGHRGLWLASGGLVLLLLVFVVLVALIAPSLPATLAGPPLVAAGLMVAFIPAVIWLVFFYQQDRLEPEPKIYVLEVFALGALLAAAIGIPMVR